MLTEELKTNTKENHQQLEKKLVARMRSMRNKEDYTGILAIFYSYFGGLEQLIQSNIEVEKVSDYYSRRKASALAADIEVLGGNLPVLATGDSLPAITNHRQALGALYVIEGSTLGGKIISEMIHKQLGLDEGLTFFRSYGDDTMAMWQRFQAVLNSPENLPADELINTANQTFLKFSNWFDLNG